MGSPKVNYPGPTAAETALTKQQVEMLGQQNQMLREYYQRQQQMEPLLFEAMGVTPQRDEAGNITGFSAQPKTDAEKAQERILNLQLQRTEQALAGNLPVDPALTRNLEEQEADLRASMLSRLGPGWETSTPGIQALAEFDKRREELFSATRRGDISMFEGLSLARQSEQDERLNQLLNRFSMVPGQQRSAALSFGAASAGYDNPLQTMQRNRSNQMMADYYRATAPSFAQQWLQPIGSMMGGMGSMVGSFGSGLTALSLACWIAEAIYGNGSRKFLLARYWLNYVWRGRLAAIAMWVYRRVGQRVAGWVRRWPLLGRLLKPLFDIAVRKGDWACRMI